jgi:hypothetical protein
MHEELTGGQFEELAAQWAASETKERQRRQSEGEKWSFRSATASEIVDALKHIPNNDAPYDYYLRMMMATKNGLGDGGDAVFDAWARQSTKYNEAGQVKYWRSIKAEGGVTVATLFYEARNHGWQGAGRTSNNGGNGDRKKSPKPEGPTPTAGGAEPDAQDQEEDLVIGPGVSAQLQYTDAWLAGRFILAHPDEFCFRQAIREWHRWTGEYWQSGMQGEVNRLISAINVKYSNSLKHKADTEKEKKAAGEPVERDPNSLLRMADRIASQSTVRSVEQLLRSMLADKPLDASQRHGCLSADIEERPVEWLWAGHIRSGRLTLLEGDPALGKSLVTIDLAARVSTGRDWPDGTPGTGLPRNVIIISAEDDEDVIKARIVAAKGDEKRIRVMPAVLREGHNKHFLSFPEDLPMLAATAKEEGAALIIIDPLVAFASRSLSLLNEHDVRRLVIELEDLAAETGAAVIALRHLKKDPGEVNPLYRGGGSIGLTAAARTVFLIGYDPTDVEPVALLRRCVFAASKMNHAATPASLAYIIGTSGPVAPAWIEWVKGTSEVTAVQILMGPDKKGSAVSKAIDLLARELASSWCTGEQIEQAAAQAKVKRATLSNARKLLGVRQALVGKVGDPASFRINWLPRVMGDKFNPAMDQGLAAVLRNRQEGESGDTKDDE